MNKPFSFADCEATFGAECVEWKAREAREAPRFTPEQILAGRRIFAGFRTTKPRSAVAVEPAADAA